ncbi:phenylalanine ammonia-lyase [Puccinia sorghi]|uniref:Phenylalanine ammonia-lyase n=1 Tax=Puccinia sorghi TaxID=27349 RepID=A0A0L6V5P7_9BASI|nr:phenylalanine ammonia-lyase [Puccinia sorghi]
MYGQWNTGWVLSFFMKKGFPSCLNRNKPSTKHHTQGLDKFCAAYFSELHYLTGHVKTHFQIGKFHNQDIKSLAFISARKTLEEIEILKMVSLNLRVFELRFNKMFGEILSEVVMESFGSQLSKGSMYDGDHRLEWMKDGLECTLRVIVDAFELENKQISVVLLERFISLSDKTIIRFLNSLCSEGLDNQMAHYLGGRQNLYYFVMFSLGVPVQKGEGVEGIQGPSIGGMVDRIFCLLQFEQLTADHPQNLLVLKITALGLNSRFFGTQVAKV